METDGLLGCCPAASALLLQAYTPPGKGVSFPKRLQRGFCFTCPGQSPMPKSVILVREALGRSGMAGVNSTEQASEGRGGRMGCTGAEACSDCTATEPPQGPVLAGSPSSTWMFRQEWVVGDTALLTPMLKGTWAFNQLYNLSDLSTTP